MGCCSVCDVETPTLPSTPSTSLRLYQEPCLETQATERDPYSLELENYTKDLLYSATWTMAADLPHVVIKTLDGSKFSNIAPVIQLELSFGEFVDEDIIESLLLNPDARKVWDTKLTAFYKISDSPRELYYTMLGFPFPFKNRDFVEVVTNNRSIGGKCIVMYSAEDHELETNHQRGTTHFTVIRIMSEGSSSKVNIVAQFDLKLAIKQQILVKYIVKVLGDWTKSFVTTALLNQKIPRKSH